MTHPPPRPPQAVLMPPPVDPGEPFSVTTGYYHTEHELTFYLRAFDRMSHTRWVVVVGLREGRTVSPADCPPNVRLILTAAEDRGNPDRVAGWFEPDPLRAVIVGMTGLRPDEGLMLLFPVDWRGPSPDDLVENARRWRSGPHSPVDDVYFNADDAK